MLRLRATLVAMAALRPVCAGWSEEGGVELAVPPAPTRPCPPAIAPEPARAAEAASFLEPGEAAAAEWAGLRPLAGPIGPRAEAVPEPAVGALQAWSRLSGRPLRS